jgi:hypothetical protein
LLSAPGGDGLVTLAIAGEFIITVRRRRGLFQSGVARD